MLSYSQLFFTREEVSSLAARAKTGDFEAFNLLIRGTINIYKAMACRICHRADYRDDVVQDAITRTYSNILPLYQPELDWITFLEVALRRRMSRYYRGISGPVTVAHEGLYADAEPLPESANGLVDPSAWTNTLSEQCETASDVLEQRSLQYRLWQELEKLEPLNRLSVLEQDTVVAQQFGISRQAVNLRKHKTVALLADRLSDWR